MCGRASLTVPAVDLRETFGLADVPVLTPRYNIAPTQPIATLRQNVLTELRWGLVPFFSEGPKEVGGRWINARAETVAKLPVFRDSFAKRRCLVVVDGFYEWMGEKKHRRPFHLRRADRKPFALAGVWDRWSSEDRSEVIESVSVVTCDARGGVRALHDRMPVILAKDEWKRWQSGTPIEALALLEPREPELVLVEVSPLVNSVKNEGPACQEEPRQLSLAR